MKNKSSLSILMFLVLHLSCAQDNPPFIETPTEINYTYETIVDGIDIPWGLDFISENDLLVTEKSGILYRVVDGQKNTCHWNSRNLHSGTRRSFRHCAAPRFQFKQHHLHDPILKH